MLRLCCAVSLSGSSQFSEARARTADLAERLRDAGRTGAAVRLPPGQITLMGLDLPDGATLIGTPGRTVLKLSGVGPLFTAGMGRKITLESLILDGAGAMVPRERGLVDVTEVINFNMHGCTVRNSDARGVNMLRSGGTVTGSVIERVGDVGFHSLDGLGVQFDNNQVRNCGDNGVMVFTQVAGHYDGSRVRNNVIEDIRNRSGGNGPFGNGVFIYGAHTVRVENNRIRRCAYSHVRNSAGVNVEVVGNDCKTCGERAMYAEFGAKNAVFRNNRIEDVGAGIGVANSDRGTDGGIVEGNTIIGMKESHPDDEFGPEMLWMTGVEAEKNAAVIGNRIVGPGWIGVAMGGWRENVRVEANEISGVDYGITFQTGEGVGSGTIARNKITGVRKAAIAARAGHGFLPGDVGRAGAQKYPKLTVSDNEIG